jgi:hypothetical protein
MIITEPTIATPSAVSPVEFSHLGPDTRADDQSATPTEQPSVRTLFLAPSG